MILPLKFEGHLAAIDYPAWHCQSDVPFLVMLSCVTTCSQDKSLPVAKSCCIPVSLCSGMSSSGLQESLDLRLLGAPG